MCSLFPSLTLGWPNPDLGIGMELVCLWHLGRPDMDKTQKDVRRWLDLYHVNTPGKSRC